MASNNAVKVAIKVRPLIKRERDAKLSVQWRIQGDTIECIYPLCPSKFSFDQICDESSSTLDLYEKVAKPIVESSVNGFNGTIFAYGQTSSGKTHTMLGTQIEPGITILAIRQIFNDMHNKSDRSFLLRVTYIEIYNEKIYDLFNNRNELKIQEMGNGDLNVGSVEKMVNSEQSIMDLLAQGNNLRRVAETNMNVQSSRSHTIFSIIIESEARNDSKELSDSNSESEGAVQISVLNLVDLAGSERADATGATGFRLKEGSHINKSLLSLSLVINKLSEDPEQQKYINYRDSKLTRLLQPSLGGNSMTAIICTITPAAVEETNYTLGFANRAKKIKNKPIVNEVLSEAATLKRLKKQISTLERQLDKERLKYNSYIQKQKDLSELKDRIIQYKERPQLIGTNRRRTWAPTNVLNNNEPNSDQGIVKERASMKPKSIPPKYIFSDFGHQIEYSDEQFKSIFDASFVNISAPICENMDTKNVEPLRRQSLLKTPKSIRYMLTRRGSDGDVSAVNSPVNTLDKDKRIRLLETELEDLQHFRQVESSNEVAEKAALNEVIAANTNEISELKSKLEMAKKNVAQAEKAQNAEKAALNEMIAANTNEISDLKSKLEMAKKSVTQAEKAQNLAECNLTSTEYEYEQYKLKTKRREQELIDQIEDKGMEQTIVRLNNRIKELCEKEKQLETEIWENEKSHKNQLNELNAKISSTIDKAESDSRQMAADYRKLQQEYDELSGQLVDSIQENDDLRKQSKSYDAMMEDMKRKIDELENKSKLELRIDGSSQTNERSADEAYSNHCFDVLPIVLTNYIDKSDSLSVKLTDLHEKLIEKSKALAMESENSAQLRDELNNVRQTLANGKMDESKNFIDSLEMQRKQHDIELNELIEKHEKAIDNIRHQHTAEIVTLNAKIAHLGEQLFLAKTQNTEKELQCTELEHEKCMLEQICNNCRITVQFFINELAILRRSYAELEINVAMQELDHLKLQKTICESGDETLNYSTSHLNATITADFSRRDFDPTIPSPFLNSTQLVAKRDESANASANLKLQQMCEKCLFYETNIQLLKAHLSNVLDEADMTINDDTEIVRKKVIELIGIHDEYNRVLELLKTNSIDRKFDTSEKGFSVLEAIIFYQGQYIESERVKITVDDELRNLKDRCNMLEADIERAKTDNENLKTTITQHNELIANLERDNRRANERIDQILSEDKTLRDQFENEKLSKVKLNETIDELAVKLQDSEARAKRLITKNQQLNILQLNQKDEIKRLEQVVADKGKIDQQIMELTKSIAEKTDKLDKATDKIKSQTADLSAITSKNNKLNNDLMNIQQHLVHKEQDLTSALDKIANLREEILNRENDWKNALNEIEMLKVKHNENIAQLEANVLRLEEFLAEKQMDLKNVRTEIDALKSSLSESAKRATDCARLEMLLADKENELKNALNEIDSLRTSLNHKIEIENELNTKIAELMDSNSTKDKELQKMSHQIDLLNAAVAEKASKETKSNMNMSELQKLMAEKEKQLKNILAEVHSLRASVAESIENKKKLAELMQTNNENETKLKDASTEIVYLKVALADSENSKSKIEERIVSLTHKIAVLEDEQECLEKENRKHLATVAKQTEQINRQTEEIETKSNVVGDSMEKLQTEMRAVVDKYNKLERMHNELKTKHMELSAEANRKMLNGNRKSLEKQQSPMRNPNKIDVDSLMRENMNLKSTHQSLINEIEELRKTTRLDRKTKRYSTHDDTRRISGFDSHMIDVQMQTEPADANCRCAEFDVKIKQLKRDIVILDAQYNTFKMDSGVEALKKQCEQLQSVVATMKTQAYKDRVEYQRLLDKYDALKQKNVSVNALLATKQFNRTDANTQTDEQNQNGTSGRTFVAEMDFFHISEKYQVAKRKYLDLNKNYTKLKTEYDAQQALAVQQQEKYSEIESKMGILQEKYEGLKRVCIYRKGEIDKYKASSIKFEEELHSALDASDQSKQKCDDLTQQLGSIQDKSKGLKDAEQPDESKSLKGVEQQEKYKFDVLQEKYEDLKRVCIYQKGEMDKYKDLSDKFEEELRSALDALVQRQHQYDDLNRQHVILQNKFESLRVVCQHRGIELDKLKKYKNNENLPSNR